MTATTATTATTKLNRFNGWVALMAFSCVVLGTLVNDFPMSVRGQKENYIIACCVIAIFLGFVAMNMYMFFETHIGTIKESSFAVIAFALWCAAIAIIQNPKNSLAVKEDDLQVVIRNTNLYFFSWASFITSAYVLSSISQDHDVVNVRNVPLKLTRWYLLMVCSVVVLGISSNLKSITCSGSSTDLGLVSTDLAFDENRCRRTDYAISFGVVTTVLTFVPIILSHCGWLKSFIEVPVAVVVLAFYCVGVAVITDTVHGPASNVGNLYFASWIGFYLAISLGFTTIKETFAPTPEPSPDSESNISKSETRGGKGDAENVAPVRQDGGDNVEGESGEA